MVMKGRVGSSRVCDEGRPIGKMRERETRVIVLAEVETRTFTHGIVDFDFLFWYGILVENGFLDIVLI